MMVAESTFSYPREKEVRIAATAVSAAFIFAVLSALRDARSAAPDPYPLASLHLAARCNPPVAIAPILTGQRYDRFAQRISVDPADHGVALCPSPQPQQPAGMSLTHFVLLSRILHRTTPPLRP
jgi:hypothetical protein